MVKRPTIPDLAEASGLSVSTVNRVINSPDKVRRDTREHVLAVAQNIGFYGVGAIEYSVSSRREYHKLGVLLQQGSRTFYRDLAVALRKAAKYAHEGNVDLELIHLEDLSPEHVAEQLVSLGSRCESVALVAAEHPKVSDAIDVILGKNVPVAGLIAPLSARGNVGFVGLDNWKVGRTAAWAFDKIIRTPGKIGILVGNHRYRNQEMNESGFRSYFREHGREFTLLEPLSTYESSTIARELTEKLFSQHPDLCGLFVSGGGITGALSALRDRPANEDFVSVGYELFDATRNALIDGTLTMAISHPLDTFAKETISALIRAKNAGPAAGAQNVALGFEIYTSENV